MTFTKHFFLILIVSIIFSGLLISSTSAQSSSNIRALRAGEELINVVVNGRQRTDIASIGTQLANAIGLTQTDRLETAALSYISSTQTLFQYIITAGTPGANVIAGQLTTLSVSERNQLGVDRIELFVTTPAPVVTAEESDVLRTVLIIAGGAAGGALVSLIIAAIFCKPRATEAEEKRMREKQEETRAKAQAEMQVQQLVRSGAFQRLQDRVIGLEKEESVRKAIGEVEEYQKKNKNIAKGVARQLLDEPFIEPQDRQIDRDTKETDAAQSKLSENERRKQKAIDIVENAPWWHNAALQAEITADLAMPRYAGLNNNDNGDEDSCDDEYTGKPGEYVKNAAAINRRRAERSKQKQQIAKIPDHLIDYSAVKIIAEGHHWLSFHQLPKCNPTIESQIMLAKSNLHGVGVFARRFIDRGTLLFPWANPTQINSAKHIYTANEMRFHFGANWDARLHFVARDPFNKKFCVAEDPKERGWGCAINSCRGTGGGLVANVECVFPDQRGAGVIPWVRVTQTIAPLGELLLDYPFPELIQQQRGLNPDQFDEPPPPLSDHFTFSPTYGSSVAISSSRKDRNNNNNSNNSRSRPQSVPPTPPPPPPSMTPQNESISPSPTGRNIHNNNDDDDDDDDDDGKFTLDVEPLTSEQTTAMVDMDESSSGVVASPHPSRTQEGGKKNKSPVPPEETLTEVIKRRAIENLDI